MRTMEFEEMKKIWDAQNNQALFVLDENALHHRIQSKMNRGLHLASSTEWSLIIVYLFAGSLLIGLNSYKSGVNIFMFIEAAWMFATVVFIGINRMRRIKASRQFDRSLKGDLDFALSLSHYQLRLSQIINLNLIPMGAIMIFSGWEAGKLIKVGALMLISYALAYYVGNKGIQANKKRRSELEILKEKLETDN